MTPAEEGVGLSQAVERLKMAPGEREELLGSVRAVARCVPRLAGVPHVVWRLDELLDAQARWTFSRACALGSLRLLRRLAKHEAASALELEEDDAELLRGANFTLGSIRAAQSGHLHVLEWLMGEYDGKTPVDRAVEEAAGAGHMEILQWLYDNYRERAFWGGNGLSYAVEGNHMEIAKWLVEHTTPPRSRKRMERATKHGSMQMIRWLRPMTGVISTTTIANAAEGGHLDALKFLVHEFVYSLVCNNVDGAAANGHLETVKWMLKKHAGCSPRAVNRAAANGHLNVLIWLHNNHTVASGISHRSSSVLWSSDAMDSAAANGHMEVVRWLEENRDEGCTSAAMDGAAANGHLDMVLWLHEHRTEGCSHAAMDGAAAGNHFHIVEWLHNHRTEGCSVAAMNNAAGNGNLEMVCWLHEHRTEGCSKLAMDWAAADGHLNVIKWLHANRTEGCSTKAMDEAAGGGHFNVITWLHHHLHEGCSPSAVNNAARSGRLDIVRWLIEREGSRCTSRGITSAARSGHLGVIMYLDSLGMAQPDDSAFADSARMGFTGIVQWLWKKRRLSCNLDDAYQEAHNYNREYCKQWLHSKGARIRYPNAYSVIVDVNPMTPSMRRAFANYSNRARHEDEGSAEH